MNGTPVISVRGIRRSFRSVKKGEGLRGSFELLWNPQYQSHEALKGVSFDIEPGAFVGLIGANGAGKTTTFYMTVGLTAPDAGQVLLDGQDVTSDPMYIRARKGIGYLPQEPSIFRGLTVEQNILAILETTKLSAAERKARARELLDELHLSAGEPEHKCLRAPTK